MNLANFEIYQLAVEVGEDVYSIISKWQYFEKDTVGKQLVRSSDSIAANLSEGAGRYHFKDRRNFGYYARGSLFETKTWITKAHSRYLIDDKSYLELINKLETLGVKLNNYIKALNTKSASPTNIHK